MVAPKSTFPFPFGWVIKESSALDRISCARAVVTNASVTQQKEIYLIVFIVFIVLSFI
jgi:hypothetical protein